MKQVRQKNNCTAFGISTSKNSPKNLQNDESESSSRGDVVFPDPEMQLGMILRMNSCTTSHASSDGKSSSILIDESQLMLLEDKQKVIQTRNVALIAENESLRDQLRDSLKKIRDLEDASIISKEESKVVIESRKFADRGISTDNISLATEERGVQVWEVCRLCERKFEGSPEITVVITKSELERLEKDMETLKDAVMTRESDWNRAMEREECYREQLKRFAAEMETARHLSDSRHGELERLAQTLAETERDLRSARKQISGLKEIIVKLERRQRELGINSGDHGIATQTRNDISEKETKWIEDITRQLACAKNKHKSKVVKEKIATNFNSNQSSPRNFSATVATNSPRSCNKEPVIVTEVSTN